MTENVGKIEASDGVVIDYLLREKGISREDLEKRLYAERVAAKELKLKEADDKIERDRLEETAKKEARALTTYNERMVATIDGRAVGKLEQLHNPPCKCGAELDFFDECVFVMTDWIHRSSAPSNQMTIGGSYVSLFNPLPMMRGTFKCPKNCVLELVIETIPARKDKDRTSI
jgi:hypothetical protein